MQQREGARPPPTRAPGRGGGAGRERGEHGPRTLTRSGTVGCRRTTSRGCSRRRILAPRPDAATRVQLFVGWRHLGSGPSVVRHHAPRAPWRPVQCERFSAILGPNFVTGRTASHPRPLDEFEPSVPRGRNSSTVPPVGAVVELAAGAHSSLRASGVGLGPEPSAHAREREK